jgi:uncharacterized protein DUF3347
MKKFSFILLPSLFMLFLNLHSSFSKTESHLVGTGSPVESQPETRSLHSKSMVDEALTLMEIYAKVRRILGKDDRSEMKVQLDQLNNALDEILSFKNSFTPMKMEKVERQMNQIKTDVSNLAAPQDLSGVRNQFMKLSDSLLKLVKTLMEPAPEDRI